MRSPLRRGKTAPLPRRSLASPGRRTRTALGSAALVVTFLLGSAGPAAGQLADPDGLLPEVGELLFGPTPQPPPPPEPGVVTSPPAPAPQLPTTPAPSPEPTAPPPVLPPLAPTPPPRTEPAPPPAERSPLDAAGALLAPLLGGLPLPVVPPGAPPPSAEPGPGRIWTLTTSELGLTGVRYRGHAQREVDGRSVNTLHFTIDRADIRDLLTRGLLGNGKDVELAARPGSTSTVQGPFELYTTELVGTLVIAGAPLLRVRLAPETLPDLDLGAAPIPSLTFTDAVVRNTDLIGGNLHVPEVFVRQRP